MTTPDDHWRPVRPLEVLPRDKGIFDVRVPIANDPTANKGPLCGDPRHAVYRGVKPLHPTAPGCQGSEKARTFYVCAVCCPPKET